jgi:hypothetical protein
MKKILLVILCLVIFCQPAKAEISVEEAYKLFRSTNPVESISILALARGIVDNSMFTAAIIYKNEKKSKCVAKDPQIWSEFVFDDYKRNKIEGDVSFSIALSTYIHSACFK